MKDTEQLNNIRIYLIEHFYMNEDFAFNSLTSDYHLLEIIANLYELAHQAITGEEYDYLWHYYNKISASVFNTYFFDKRGNHK